MRRTRPRHRDLSDEDRRRANARAYLNVYVRRGKVQRGPCSRCGTTKNVHGHHEDYDRPLDVIWLCARCHRLRHRVDAAFAALKLE